MKRFLALVFLLSTLTVQTTHADTLNCTLDSQDDTITNHSYVIADTVSGVCDGRSFEISGVGPGIRIQMGTAFMISCPGVSDRKFKGRYYGIKADASLLVGADAGVYLGRNGLCVIGGLAAGLGAALTGSVLTIK